MDQVIAAAVALDPEGRLGPYWVRVEDGMIRAAGPGKPPRAADLYIADGVLAPGLVDVHAHGGGGASFGGGVDEAPVVVHTHRARGTTTMLASLVSAPVHVLTEQTRQLAPLVQAGDLAGVHWEGPWLSPEYRGAHELSMLEVPSDGRVSALLGDPVADLIRYVTIAPELPGALAAVDRLASAGITVGIGHSGASTTVTRAALSAGASAGTHLFNGMGGLHHRDPGPALPLLLGDGIFIELICDGLHLHPEMIGYAWHSVVGDRGPEWVVLISDAMAAAGAGDGDYMLGNLSVQVRDRVARLAGDGGPSEALAGSTLTVADAVRYSIVEVGIPAPWAVAAATANPARMAGLSDVGRLASGTRADLVVFDDEWRVRGVMYCGNWMPASRANGVH